MSKFTDFLYARPSFLEGVARMVDIRNILQEYNTSSSPELADERAIRADWHAIGNDVREVIKKRRRIRGIELNGEGNE